MNSIGSNEILINNGGEDADEPTKLEYSASEIEKHTVENVAVVPKGEAAKEFKVGTNTWMKKNMMCDKCENIFF